MLVSLEGEVGQEIPELRANVYLALPDNKLVVLRILPQSNFWTEDELEKLKVQRSQVTVELRKAAADKDFRENAPLHAAREKKSYIEGRIQEIENVLKKVHIVDGSAGTTTVKAGYTVELEEVMSGKQRIFMLVGSKEANPSRGKLSIESPIGKELLNKEIDDTVKVTAPAGTFEYRIKSIKPSS